MRVRTPATILLPALACAALVAVAIPQKAEARFPDCAQFCPTTTTDCPCSCGLSGETKTCGVYNSQGCDLDALAPTGGEGEVSFLQAGEELEVPFQLQAAPEWTRAEPNGFVRLCTEEEWQECGTTCCHVLNGRLRCEAFPGEGSGDGTCERL